MSYENPRDRLELFLKKIIDKSTAPAERRTRFEQFLAGILDGSLVPADPRDRLELYLKGVAESGGYIPPSGTISIVENGTYNVEQYKYADVDVPGIEPTGTINITTNGTHDVAAYASANVNVPGIVPTGTLNITANGTHNVSTYASVNVNVPSGSSLRFDSRTISGIPSGIVMLGWRPDKLVISYVWKDPEYDPDDPDHNVAMYMRSQTLTDSTDITGEGDYVTFRPNGYACSFEGTGFNDFPEDYSDFVFTAVGLGA